MRSILALKQPACKVLLADLLVKALAFRVFFPVSMADNLI